METDNNYVDDIPSKFINLFILIVITLFIVTLIGLLIIKQPDIVSGNIKLIAHSVPFELPAPHTGKLVLLKHNNDSVHTSQDIAYISNSTEYDIVKKISILLEKRDYFSIYETLQNNSLVKQTGTLSNSCMNLRSEIYKYSTFYDKSLYEESRGQLEMEIATLKAQIDLHLDCLKIEEKTLKTTFSNFNEDSLLYEQKAITKVDFDRSFKVLLAQQKQFIEAKNALLTYQKEKNAKELKLQELTIDNMNNTETLQQNVERTISILQNEIEIWRKQYVITSPIDGKLEVISPIESNQIVSEGLAIFRILPINKDIIGQILFTSRDAGDIKDKSLVKIYLDSYPEAQNGYLAGYISDLSSSVYIVQSGESFHSAKVHINFNKQPNFYGKFRFTHNMTGRADIIIKKKNILAQIMNVISSNI